MDLWIRSQNKQRLLKVDNLQIINNKEDVLFPYYINASYELLGAYKTLERALEVLDEIHKFVAGEQAINTINKQGGNMQNLYPIIFYNMPSE